MLEPLVHHLILIKPLVIQLFRAKISVPDQELQHKKKNKDSI